MLILLTSFCTGPVVTALSVVTVVLTAFFYQYWGHLESILSPSSTLSCCESCHQWRLSRPFIAPVLPTRVVLVGADFC